MDAKKIADAARDSIGDYCMNECHAYCCRKGYLQLTVKEAALIMTLPEKDLRDTETLKQIEDDTFLLELGDSKHPCPQLKGNGCSIHGNPERPESCRDFPLFFEEDNKVRLSQRCPAVRLGKLYPFVAELVAGGFELN